MTNYNDLIRRGDAKRLCKVWIGLDERNRITLQFHSGSFAVTDEYFVQPNGYVAVSDIDALPAVPHVSPETFAELQAKQTYHYIGKDGKPVLARDLEDERDELRAELAKLDDELTEALAFKDCACAHDTPTDICLGHNRLFERVFGKRLEAAIAELKGEK